MRNVFVSYSHRLDQDVVDEFRRKFGNDKMKVVFDIPETNTFGYAVDTKMKLNSDKLKELGLNPRIGLEESYRRMIQSMVCTMGGKSYCEIEKSI